MKPPQSVKIACLLCAVMMLPAVMQAQFLFTTNNDGSLNIYQYTGSGGAVTIPSTTNGLPVTSIRSNAFHMSSVTSVTIGTNVTSIGDYAFQYCGLTNVTIPNSVTSIGDEAFYDCYGLISVTIPNSVTNIGDYAFYDCVSLNNITIPNSVTNIGDEAFQCTGLTSVTIGTNVTSIGAAAFKNCTSLTNVTIPNSVTSIGSFVFYGCIKLTAITVATNNPAYSSMAGVLFDKSKTTLIQCPGGKAGSYTIPNSVTNIGDYVFSYCYHLTSVTIPNSVTSIGNYAFYYCSGLTNVTVPNSVTRIGGWAFACCYLGLTSVTIGNSVTNIGDEAFYDCYHLTSLYFQGNAPSLGAYVFYGENNPTVYYMPGTSGWSSRFGDPYGHPTVLWNPQPQTSDASFGVQSNQFGFNITGSSNLVIVVEACTNLATPIWSPVGTNTLNIFIGTNGTSYFSDPKWTNYPGRFYRIRSL